MGYTKTIHKVEKVKAILDFLVKADQDLELLPPLPNLTVRDFAYMLHEGIAAAEEFALRGEPFKSYAELKHKYKIRERRDKVILELKGKILPVMVQNHAQEMVLIDFVDTLSVIGALIKFKPAKVKFPNFDFENQSIDPIKNWAEKNNYIIKVEDNMLSAEKQL